LVSFLAPEGTLIKILLAAFPAAQAIYAFGSQASGNARVDSDLDLAILVENYADPETLWKMSGELATLAKCEVDLLDLRAASTVMQYQVITTGRCIWSRSIESTLFELLVLSEKLALDTARAPLMQDIIKDGKIYG
jgi:predicted nucleotidyltransferase